MTGINRYTGRPIDGFANVAQKLKLLWVTRFGSRFMRRTIGSAVPSVLGQSLTLATVLRWKTAIIVATELFEPRFAITSVGSIDGTNSPEKMRLGNLALEVIGEYRPRAHLGDLTPDNTERRLSFDTSDVEVMPVRAKYGVLDFSDPKYSQFVPLFFEECEPDVEPDYPNLGVLDFSTDAGSQYLPLIAESA